MYVLVREDGKFVCMPGREHSYTDKLQDARVFQSVETANYERCGNESVVSVESILIGWQKR